VKAVIEVFREPSRSFLMPPAPEPLEPETVIDISHESLMRVWERLRRWAEEEANSARRYRRLAETAALEQTGKARLWRDPDLQLALDWKEEQAPTPAWANLYGGDFESATAFLERSRSERDHELAEAVFEQRWKRIRLIIVLLLLITGIFLWRLRVGDFEWWSDKFGYKSTPTTPASQAESLPLGAQSLQEKLEAVRHYGKRSVWDTALLLLTITCFLGPYFLGYFALAYFGKWGFRRFAFPKILKEVALSSNKAVREQKLAAGALKEAVAVELPMPYATFWRRLGAYVLDLGIFLVGTVVVVAVMALVIDSLPKKGGDGLFIVLLILLSPFVFDWLYDAMMLSSRCQATLGMLGLGIFATDQKGDRLHFTRATVRHFGKVLSYISIGTGFFIQPFTQKRQTLHDLIVGSVVLVRPNKKKVQSWIVALCVIIGLTEACLTGGYIQLANSRRKAVKRYWSEHTKTAAFLFSQYATNQINADRLYKGRIFTVSGAIKSISQSGEKVVTVELLVPFILKGTLKHMCCIFNHPGDLEQKQAGNPITLMGTVAGVRGDTLLMENCHLLRR